VDYAGLYINLDRCPDRRAEVEGELARFGLCDSYVRFAGIDGNSLGFPNPHLGNGEVGCFASHARALRHGASLGRHLHLIEDDVLFCSQTAQVLQSALAGGLLQPYDILYTDVGVPALNDVLAAYLKLFRASVSMGRDGKIEKANFKILDLKEIVFSATSSYLVNKDSAAKLADLYEAELARGAQKPLDIFVRKLCHEGVLRVGCLVPFVTSVRLDRTLTSSVDADENKLLVLAGNVARQAFFVGCDWGSLDQVAKTYFPLAAPDAQTDILRRVLSSSLEDFKGSGNEANQS
jgi:GR25 family glycosyltransferase involved in LPS biosynthesis